MKKIFSQAPDFFKNISLRISIILLATLIALGTVNYYNNLTEQKGTVNVLSTMGSRGEEVRQIQKKLKQLGYYNGTVDGIYGADTRSAVKAFQKKCGLTVDGIAGNKTLLYLGITSNGSSSVTTSSDAALLAKLIYAEARGESYTGQVAVGAVVLNRVKHSSFPDSISGVVYQSGAFSSVYSKNWYLTVSDTAKKAAQAALNGWDPSGGAIYFYNPAKTSNAWIRSRTVIKVIGNHRFCK